MVSKARDDLPEPESPVKTTSLSRGIDSVTFFRLCSRAPRMVIWSVGMQNLQLFLLSCYGKRSARGRDEPAVLSLYPAGRHHRPPAGVDHAGARTQCLAHPGGVDEAELQVEAHGADDAWLDGAQ